MDRNPASRCSHHSVDSLGGMCMQTGSVRIERPAGLYSNNAYGRLVPKYTRCAAAWGPELVCQSSKAVNVTDCMRRQDAVTCKV